METILNIIVPAVILGYYLRSNWLKLKDRKIILGILIGGTLIFYAGVFIGSLLGSNLKLLGTCLFFTVVAINVNRHSKERAQNKN